MIPPGRPGEGDGLAMELAVRDTDTPMAERRHSSSASRAARRSSRSGGTSRGNASAGIASSVPGSPSTASGSYRGPRKPEPPPRSRSRARLNSPWVLLRTASSGMAT